MNWVVDFSRYKDGSTCVFSYADIRSAEYRKAFGDHLEDQLDFIYKNGIDSWSAVITSIKSQVPKTINMEDLP